MLHRRSLLLMFGATLGATLARTARAAPHDLRWVDAARSRVIPLRLRLPEGDAPCPLVLFSHGLGGSLDAGTAWAEAWAAAGIATLHLQHAGSDREVLRNGVRALLGAANAEQLVARCADVRFVLNELERRRAEFPRLRLDRLGMAGHSFGAHTTLALAGQAYGHTPARAGRQALAEPRLRAFAAFSPSPGDARASDPAQSFGEIRRPVLCLTGSLDTDPTGRHPERQQDGLWRRAVYDGLPAGDKAELWLDGADHMSFGGHLAGRRRERPAAAAEQAERHRALIAQVSTAWWRAQLLDDPEARAALARPPLGLLSADAWRRG